MSHGRTGSLFTEEYDAYMRQQDVTYTTEVTTTTTTVVQEPSVVLSQYEMEQRRRTTPMSFISETVPPSFCLFSLNINESRFIFKVKTFTQTFFLQEFRISAFEERIIQEVELRIMMISYTELMTGDGEVTVTVAEEEAVLPAFNTPVKNYRIMDGMGVTFHCKMAGNPLPKVPRRTSNQNTSIRRRDILKCSFLQSRTKLGEGLIVSTTRVHYCYYC